MHSIVHVHATHIQPVVTPCVHDAGSKTAISKTIVYYYGICTTAAVQVPLLYVRSVYFTSDGATRARPPSKRGSALHRAPTGLRSRLSVGQSGFVHVVVPLTAIFTSHVQESIGHSFSSLFLPDGPSCHPLQIGFVDAGFSSHPLPVLGFHCCRVQSPSIPPTGSPFRFSGTLLCPVCRRRRNTTPRI